MNILIDCLILRIAGHTLYSNVFIGVVYKSEQALGKWKKTHVNRIRGHLFIFTTTLSI